MKDIKFIRNLSLIFLITLFSFPVETSASTYEKKKEVAEVQMTNKEDNSKTVSLVTSGTGATKEEARNNALRSAIEQAFGTFVSANTAVVNDDLVKDEIITLTSGNVKSFDEINSRQFNGKDGILFETTLQAIVSIDNLVSFAKNHGMSAELAGQTFAINIKMAQLNKENENKALQHLIIQLYEIAKLGLYDFSINVKEPKMEDGVAIVEAYVLPTPNANYRAYVELAKKTISSLSMSPTEFSNAQSRGLGAYVCGWKEKEVSERTGLVTARDFFIQGKGEYRLRNNINEFHESTDNEWFEITNGANFIYYYERFKYLSKFAFGLQDNIGNKIATAENLDRLPKHVNLGEEKRMISFGGSDEFRHGYYEEKFVAIVPEGKFVKFGSRYDLQRGYAGFDEVSACYYLGYNMSQISNLSKIDVFPQTINLLDNETIMKVCNGTARPSELYDNAKNFIIGANEASNEKRIRYLNMADDLYELLQILLPDNEDKSDIQNARNKIKTASKNTL